LDRLNSNKMLPHIQQDFRIVASLINCFYRRVRVNKDSDILIAQLMKERLKQVNTLERIVNRYNLVNLSNFKLLTDDFDINFPRLSFDDIENYITLGKYQIEQGFGNIREHFEKSSDIQLYILEKEITSYQNSIVCTKFYSRHRSETIYKVYVEFKPHESSYK
jgi:hypothetical protein